MCAPAKGRDRPWFQFVWAAGFLVVASGVLLLAATSWHRGELVGLLLRPLARPQAPTWQERLPWQPKLTRQELARAVEHYGSGERIRHVASKLLDGQPIKVTLLGGSVTVGWGATEPSSSYAERFAQLLNSTFPHRGHKVVNNAVSASRSSLSAACVERMVPPNTDLVVVEFSINDDFYGNDRATFEQLLRKLLQLGPAVVVLHHYQWNVRRIQDQALGMPRGVFWWNVEQHYSLLAQYYDIPSVSIASAAWRLMAAAVEGFKVDKYDAVKPSLAFPYIERAPENERAAYFFSDPHHPGDEGHKVLAEALAAPLLRAVGEVQAQRLLPPSTLSALLLPMGGMSSGIPYRRTDTRLVDPPPPMLPGNHEQRTLFCAMPVDLKHVVKAASGFQYRAERPNATDFVRQKWGFSAYKPGDWLELEIDTRLDGHNASSASQHVVVAFGCLHSYEHMGVAEAKCTSGCTCNGARFDATWKHRVSVSAFLGVLVTQHQQCRIRITILENAGAVPSGEHKFVVTAAIAYEFNNSTKS